ncbi:MAG TPA: DNA-directed RNA polymerase subunit omega [Pyrinomonadaceae bacterium]|nr:DNA-directed RNA polymerase subunit omega [Pyrinomonadaceae bacterium]
MKETSEKDWLGVMSRFQLVILASLRSKQLLKGAHPRIAADPRKRRNTSIALEELKRGLVPFKGRSVALAENGETPDTAMISLSLLGQGAEPKLVEAELTR